MKTVYMKQVVTCCDGLQKTYSSPQSGAVMLKEEAASGAWKIASMVGPEYIEKHGIQPMSEEKVKLLVEQKGGYLSL